MSLFERPVALRPGVELRGYVAMSLWQKLRNLEPTPHAPTGRISPMADSSAHGERRSASE